MNSEEKFKDSHTSQFWVVMRIKTVSARIREPWEQVVNPEVSPDIVALAI